ncbi:MAG TPA: STAS domain-containing protein [Streptosporangiaceae bacterium]
MGDTGSGANHVFLIAYGQVSGRRCVRVSMAGELGSGGAELLGACRARIRAMPVSSVRVDLRALRATDEAGARSLAALCRILRLEGLQVEVHGIQAAVNSVLLQMGLTLGIGAKAGTA